MNEEQIRHHSQIVARQWAGILFIGNTDSLKGGSSPPEPLPPYNARALRQSLHAYTAKDDLRAFGWWLINIVLFFFGQYLVVACPLALKPLGGLIAALAAVRLFFLGHDAGHGSLTRFKPLNAWLGRLAFLPSLTAYQSWTFSHNQHHHFANSMTGDLWAPLSPEDYLLLNYWRRALYRLYRSPWGAGLYYLVEVWWRYFYYPSPKHYGTDQARLLLPDGLLVIGFSLAWQALLYGLAVNTSQAYAPLWLAGFALPFAITNTVIGFVSYLQHTHPEVNWQQQPIRATPFLALPALTVTVHIRFPVWLSWSLHHIMEHPAHHLYPGIPFYQLPAAQRQLETLLPDIIVVQDFSWRWYSECIRICKLYDFENHCWLNYDGKRFD